MNRPTKETIYRETVSQYTEWYGEEHAGNGACLYWSLTAGAVFQRHGIRSLLQAGTMLWPACEDHGTNNTHFGYTWSPEDIGSKAALKLGLFPEIHIWIGLPETQEIVDFSVRHLPELAAKDGVIWTLPRPPEFLWATKDELPEGVRYMPEIPAMNWLLARLMKDGHVKQSVPAIVG
jgi:hypothetical protein